MSEELLEGHITGPILDQFYRVYDQLGLGFLEAVYCNALAIEFTAEGMQFRREVPVEVSYKGRRVSANLAYASEEQLLNCLRSSNKEVGLLLHFGPKARFKRMVHSNSRKSVAVTRPR